MLDIVIYIADIRKSQELRQVRRGSLMNGSVEQKSLLTVAEVKEKLSLGITKIFQLIASGELKSIQIGKSRRIPVMALEEFIDSLCEASGHWISSTENEIPERKQRRN